MTDNIKLLESIHTLVSQMNDKINNLESKINNLESKISVLDNKISGSIDNIEKNIESSTVKNMPIRNFKKEKIELEDIVVRKLLERTTIGADFELFKLMYLNVDKELYPIKRIDNDYYYWNNGFYKDGECEQIKLIISSNLRHCYFKVNKYDEGKENSDKFIKNQEHIDLLKDDKYQMRLIEYISKRL